MNLICRDSTWFMVGSYGDDEPASPWRVALCVDERGSEDQRDILAEIFPGRAGGTVFRNFAAAIGEVYAVSLRASRSSPSQGASPPKANVGEIRSACSGRCSGSGDSSR